MVAGCIVLFFFRYLQLSPSKVYKYLSEQFGDITVASFIPGFAFIMLDYFNYDYDQVKKVLAENRIEIEGHSIPVKQADPSNLPYEMYKRIDDNCRTPVEVNQTQTEASSNTLLKDVNEDCICKILQLLSLEDLCSVSKTCVLLNGISKTVFERKYRTKNIVVRDLKGNGEMMTQIRYFLNNFGSSATSINLSGEIQDCLHSDVLGVLDQQCKKIRTLVLDMDLMENVVIDNYIEMFGRLKELYIHSDSLPLNRLLAACTQLEKLVVTSYDNIDLDFINVTLPNLVAFKLRLFNCYGVEKFLKRHPGIEIFEFLLPMPINSDRHHDHTNELIHRFVPNIREMELYEYSDDGRESPRFSRMKNLKSVVLYFGSSPVAPSINVFLAQSTPIEEMHLFEGTVDNDAIEAICKMQTITKINFSNCTGFDSNNFMRLVESLPKLEKIFTCSDNEPIGLLGEILPILKSKRIEWLNEMDGGVETGSYVSCIPL